MNILHQILGNTCRKCQSQPFVFVHEVFVNHTCQEHSSKERAEDTDNQCGSKTADRTCTEIEQDDTGKDWSQVRVKDCRECIRVTVSQSSLDTLSCSQLFFCTFVNQYVGIHRHTQWQHHTGNTRHCQCSLERGKNTQRKEEVHNQGTVGNHTRNQSVHSTHVNHQQNQCHNEWNDTLVDRFLTQWRTNDIFLNNACRSRHLTGSQYVSQVLCYFGSKVTANQRMSVGDFTVYVRSTIYIIIQYNGNGFSYIIFCQNSPATRTVSVHRHTHARFAEAVELILGISNHVTFQRSASVTFAWLDGI